MRNMTSRAAGGWTPDRPPAMGEGMRLFVPLVVAAAGTAVWGLGCEAGDTASFEQTLTSTVTIGNASGLRVDTILALSVVGERRDDILVRLEATLTASSVEAAEQLLSRYQIQSQVADAVVEIIIAPPEDGVLSGTAEVRTPQDLDLRVLERSGPLQIDRMEGAIVADSVGATTVLRAESDVVLRIENGAAFVDTALRASNRIDVGVGTGNVQLNLPTPLNARIQAESSAGVVSNHPELPSRPASVPYLQTVGGGAASVVATTRSGSVVFTQR